MPKSVLNWKPRRTLSESDKATPAEFLAAGRELLEADMPVEAADFMARAEDSEGLNLVKAKAIGEGNFFLYRLALTRLKAEPDPGELEALADKAASLGLATYETSARNLLTENKTIKRP
ncbi:MAG: hypothetical protein LBJ61_12650 [Deltaproteobacteria bacterium]|jgi:hypothetical protein|nr:hypothetical protein [Deltaproteobacteria bacterium]